MISPSDANRQSTDVDAPCSDCSATTVGLDGLEVSAVAPKSLELPGRFNPDTDPHLPVRMLNEFTYCPRLGYLEWVLGEWEENLETRQGTFGHRHVDKPDRKQITSPNSQPVLKEPENEVVHARSMMLASDTEGLLAKLDLLELEGDVATPVDYKRGKAPDVPEGAYEPERVQLCAQGLILRDHGYQCDEGVLYFIASKRRVTIPFTDELIARTRELAQQFREVAATKRCPPPLDDSPKCPRCSLVGICLPDETNWLRDRDLHELTQAPAKDGLRKLLPARHNALPIYVQTQGAFIGKSGERLVVKVKQEKVADVRLLDVSQVVTFGQVMFSASAIQELTKRNIPICHLTYGGWFHSLTTGLSHKNVELRIQQYQVAGDPERSLAVAKQLIVGKIKNCRTQLRRHIDNKKHSVLARLSDYQQRVQHAESADSLLGLEGMAAKEYFAEFFKLLPNTRGLAVENRNRRPPRDPVNAVLSFLYSLLTKELTVALQAVGFDPMLGVFHTPRYGRPSLALDLAEEFRSLIADSTTLMVFNNREVNSDSFIQRAGSVAMTDAGRRSVIKAYERRLEQEVTHPIFGYKVSYRRILEVQSRLLARHILGELPEYPSFTTR